MTNKSNQNGGKGRKKKQSNKVTKDDLPEAFKNAHESVKAFYLEELRKILDFYEKYIGYEEKKEDEIILSRKNGKYKRTSAMPEGFYCTPVN